MVTLECEGTDTYVRLPWPHASDILMILTHFPSSVVVTSPLLPLCSSPWLHFTVQHSSRTILKKSHMAYAYKYSTWLSILWLVSYPLYIDVLSGTGIYSARPSSIRTHAFSSWWKRSCTRYRSLNQRSISHTWKPSAVVGKVWYGIVWNQKQLLILITILRPIVQTRT
jgi:hypothetical protein